MKTEKSNRTRVILSGKTQPGVEMTIGSDKIPVLNKRNKIQFIPVKSITTKKSTAVADSKGYFELHLDLPNQSVQLPFRAIPASGNTSQSRVYQLNLLVQKQEVTATNLKNLRKSPAFQNKFGIWFGSGFNYLQYKQTSPRIGSNLDYQSFKGPSYFAKVWLWINDEWDLSATAKISPGDVDSSDEVQVADGAYNWVIYAGEATYYPADWTPTYFKKYKGQVGVRFGIQHHIVPFIARTGESETEVDIETNNITMATVGLKTYLFKSARWTYEAFMRFQYPVIEGDEFDVFPKFAFDGSVGAIYNSKKNWQVGVFWYGQWHEYAFTHDDQYFKNQSQDAEISGDQTLFFSNIELRLGYNFK